MLFIVASVPRRAWYLMATILLLFCTNPPALSRAFDDVMQEKKFYFGGFESEREKLISGIVHGVGKRTYVYPDGEVVTGSNETLFIAFDYSKGLMRVDREIPSRLDNSESRELQAVFHTQFIRMPVYDICVARERNAKLDDSVDYGARVALGPECAGLSV